MSWLLVAVATVRAVRTGDFSLLRYWAMMVPIGVMLVWSFPQYSAVIVASLWVVTQLMPSLLMRVAALLLDRLEFGPALWISRIMVVCQPIGPATFFAQLIRYRCYCGLGSTASAARIEKNSVHLPASQRQTMEYMTLTFQQRWPELCERLRSQPITVVAALRIRAAAEIGDIPSVIDDCAALMPRQAVSSSLQRIDVAVIAACAGRDDVVDEELRDAVPAQRIFWRASALGARGDDRALVMLKDLQESGPIAFRAFVAWRLAHPLMQVDAMAPAVRQRLTDTVELIHQTRRHLVRKPWVTWGIAVICLYMFILTQMGGHQALQDLGGFITRRGWSDAWWRCIAASFLHINVVHIIMNLFALFILAPGLERAMGWARFLALYLGAGVGGHVVVGLLAALNPGPPQLVVGASGCIMGLIGALLGSMMCDRARTQSWWRHKPIRKIALIVALQSIFDLAHPNVSQAAHIGGFVTGFFLYFLLRPQDQVAAHQPVPTA